MLKKMCLITVGILALSGCSAFEPWEEGNDVAFQEEQRLPDVLAGAVYKVERPYVINGVWYYPEENYKYAETGLASWYVPKDGDKAITANGELYIPSAISARHQTLPLPSIVRITNLENGKTVVARVNDRGPMVNNRLIDVSQKGAELLEMPRSGTVKVKVEILPAESQAVRDELVNAGRIWQENIKPKDLDSVPPMPVPEMTPAVEESKVLYQPVTAITTVAEAGRGVYVRLGAFGSAANAEKAKRAANSVAGAVEDTIVRNGQNLTIVKAGPFATQAEAKAAIVQLRHLGYRDAYIAK